MTGTFCSCASFTLQNGTQLVSLQEMILTFRDAVTRRIEVSSGKWALLTCKMDAKFARHERSKATIALPSEVKPTRTTFQRNFGSKFLRQKGCPPILSSWATSSCPEYPGKKLTDEGNFIHQREDAQERWSCNLIVCVRCHSGTFTLGLVMQSCLDGLLSKAGKERVFLFLFFFCLNLWKDCFKDVRKIHFASFIYFIYLLIYFAMEKNASHEKKPC